MLPFFTFALVFSISWWILFPCRRRSRRCRNPITSSLHRRRPQHPADRRAASAHDPAPRRRHSRGRRHDRRWRHGRSLCDWLLEGGVVRHGVDMATRQLVNSRKWSRQSVDASSVEQIWRKVNICCRKLLEIVNSVREVKSRHSYSYRTLMKS